MFFFPFVGAYKELSNGDILSTGVYDSSGLGGPILPSITYSEYETLKRSRMHVGSYFAKVEIVNSVNTDLASTLWSSAGTISHLGDIYLTSYPMSRDDSSTITANTNVNFLYTLNDGQIQSAPTGSFPKFRETLKLSDFTLTGSNYQVVFTYSQHGKENPIIQLYQSGATYFTQINPDNTNIFIKQLNDYTIILETTSGNTFDGMIIIS